MSAWLISLPFVAGLAIMIFVMITVGIGSYAIVRRIPGGESDEVAKLIAGHMRRFIGVLLGLMLSTVFAFAGGRFVKVQDSVEVEAAQLGDLHHDLSRLQSIPAQQVQALIYRYLKAVVREEWKALAEGHESEITNRLFLSIEDRVLLLPGDNDFQRQLKSRLLEDIDEISDLRQARVYSAGSGLDWYAFLVVLAFALLMTTFRFYSPTAWTRFYFVGYAVLIAMVLYSTFALNYPFQSGSVSPGPFDSIARSMSDSASNEAQ